MKLFRPLGIVITAGVLGAGLLYGANLLSPPASTAATVSPVASITEFPLAWPKETASGSTHELTYNHAAPSGSQVFWVTGQTHDGLARVTLNGQPAFFAMPSGSGPHGIQFDAATSG